MASYVYVPFSHKSMISSTEGYKKISFSLSGNLELEISHDNIEGRSFIYNYGGKLYGIWIIGHMLYGLIIL